MNGTTAENKHAAVLVPLDGLPLAETALPFARLFADMLHLDARLIRVVDQTGSAAMEAHAQTYLEAIAASLRPTHVDTRIMRGEAGACIVQAAKAPDTALVVMTTHARSGLRRAVLGSVAASVVAHAPVPTVLIREGVHPPSRVRNIVVPVDATGVAPLRTIIQLAQPAGASVTLLRVVAPEERWCWQWHPGPVLEECEAAANARQRLADLAAALQASDIAATVRIETGAVVDKVNRVAGQLDAELIVMTTHGKIGVERALVGSVADAVLRTAHQPVLLCRLVPPPPGAANPADVARALRHLPPPLVPQSIPEPLASPYGTWC